MSFSVQGLSQEITLIQSAEVLGQFGEATIGFLLLATVLLLPAIYLLCLLYLFFAMSYPGKRVAHKPLLKRILKLLSFIKPWLMVDVFLIGVLVSLVKIASLADVKMGISFWAFAIYTVLVVKTISTADLTWTWQQLLPMQLAGSSLSGKEFQQQTHLACHTCGLVHSYNKDTHLCARCDSHLHHFAHIVLSQNF
jgi:paraquat-inducible protein A